MNIELWPIERLAPNALNPRGPIGPNDNGIAELADSIIHRGLLQPIITTSAGLIITGHRRHAACLVANLTHVFVSIKDIPESEQFEIMLVENMQRADLSRLQLAHAYQYMQQSGLTAQDIAAKLSVSFASVRKHLDILRLPQIIQPMFNELPLGYIPSLIELDGYPEIQIELAERAAVEGWEINRMMSEATRRDPDRPKSAPQSIAETRAKLLRSDKMVIGKLSPAKRIQIVDLAIETLISTAESLRSSSWYMDTADEIEELADRLKQRAIDREKNTTDKLLLTAETERELQAKRRKAEREGYGAKGEPQINHETGDLYIQMTRTATTTSPPQRR